MHLVNILHIITFSCLEGHSNFNNSDFNSFRGFWDTLYNLVMHEHTLVHWYAVRYTVNECPLTWFTERRDVFLVVEFM
jgi:hypothetical protein